MKTTEEMARELTTIYCANCKLYDFCDYAMTTGCDKTDKIYCATPAEIKQRWEEMEGPK